MDHPPKTIMVVEDDPDCLEATIDALQYGGYEVVTAANGLEALRYLDSHPAPELVLLDLMLPVMDGAEFLSEQRARPALARIPVALFSAAHELERRATELAVAGYIRKPADLASLLDTVRRLAGPPGVTHDANHPSHRG